MNVQNNGEEYGCCTLQNVGPNIAGKFSVPLETRRMKMVIDLMLLLRNETEDVLPDDDAL
jgi:hypothetical protein